MHEKEYLDYEHYGEMLKLLVFALQTHKKIDFSKFSGVYGIPRGGIPIAVHISHNLNLSLLHYPQSHTQAKILIVDDIVDTGLTLSTYKQKSPSNNFFASLYYKPHSLYSPDLFLFETTKWIVFPWEDREEIPNRPEIIKDSEQWQNDIAK